MRNRQTGGRAPRPPPSCLRLSLFPSQNVGVIAQAQREVLKAHSGDSVAGGQRDVSKQRVVFLSTGRISEVEIRGCQDCSPNGKEHVGSPAWQGTEGQPYASPCGKAGWFCWVTDLYVSLTLLKAQHPHGKRSSECLPRRRGEERWAPARRADLSPSNSRGRCHLFSQAAL